MEDGWREGFVAGNRGTQASLKVLPHQGGRPREVAHAQKSRRAKKLGLEGAGPGPGGACGRVPPPPSAPSAARPAGVRPERAAEPEPSFGRWDPTMASLPPLLCLCVAAAHLAGARGEAPPVPRLAPQAPERLAVGLVCPAPGERTQGPLASPGPGPFCQPLGGGSERAPGRQSPGPPGAGRRPSLFSSLL